MTTATRQLIEARILDAGDIDFEAWVRSRREDGASWYALRAEIADRTGVTVSHQTLINWFGQT